MALGRVGAGDDAVRIATATQNGVLRAVLGWCRGAATGCRST